MRGETSLFCKTMEQVISGSMWRKQKILKTVLLLHVEKSNNVLAQQHELLKCPGIKLSNVSLAFVKLKLSLVGNLLYSSFYFSSSVLEQGLSDW